MTLPDGIVVRALRDDDSFTALTELLHRAYADLAASGLRYLASHQDEATTRRRARAGECFIVEHHGRMAGTITFLDAERTDGSPWYDRADVASFNQFCVDPALRKRGIGAALLDLAEARARETGAAELACDTAEQATHLIEMYGARGYRFVEYVDWRPTTNYRSVVLSKTL